MIAQITGTLVRVGEGEAILEVGAIHYQVFVPEFVRRQLASRIGEILSLRTIEYLEGNPQQGRLVPRIVGFLNEAEIEFFELVCSVDGMGVKKTLRSMVRPVREVAEAIEEQNLKELATLPGIGPAMAERIVAKLRRKMTRFALMVSREVPSESTTERSVMMETYEALLALGYNAAEAREKIESVSDGKKYKTVEDVILAIYQTRND